MSRTVIEYDDSIGMYEGFGWCHVGTRGRLIHLAEYNGRTTICGQVRPWNADVGEGMSGDLCEACEKVAEGRKEEPQ